MVNGWKVAAIVFFILFVLETIVFVWAWKVGIDIIEEENNAQLRKNKCSIEACSGYESFYYDDASRLCECYVGKVLKHQEIIE